jgi:hypothetical protein
VFAGSFNPAIFHPQWYVLKELLPGSTAWDAAEHTLTSPDLSAFTADWLGVQVTQQQAVFSTVDQARAVDLRDIANGAVSVLAETPVDAIGINTDVHFRAPSQEAWNALGDRFVPKDYWQPLFDDELWRDRSDGLRVGMRTVTVEAWRDDITGYVRVEAAPSVRVTPHGIYIGINAHFQLSTIPPDRSNGYEASVLLNDQWEPTRLLERELIEKILASVDDAI